MKSAFTDPRERQETPKTLVVIRTLVYHLHLGHGPRHYRLTAPDEPYYVVVRTLRTRRRHPRRKLDDARAAISDQIGYQASFTHFPIIGVCPGCTAGVGTGRSSPAN